MSPINAKTPIGTPFLELPEVDSTNIYAIDKVRTNLAAHGAAFFAHHQTAGKGQRGKQWNAEPGSNILLSVVIDPAPLLINQQFAISVMAALAVHDFFSAFAGDETKIKWPNDLYWRDRKAGGILIDNPIQGNKWQYSVIGMGININQTLFPADLQRPVSLKQITGHSSDPVGLARQLCDCLEVRYQQLMNGEKQQQLTQYNELLFKKDEMVTLKKENIVFHARIRSVNQLGELLVEDGLEDQFSFGEISWMN